MDHIELLKKYIRYVHDCEGIDFIEGGQRGYRGDEEFTSDQWRELERVQAEAWSERGK